MLQYNEFLKESLISEAVTKADWLKVFSTMDKKDLSNESKFLDAAHKTLGINVYAPSMYKKTISAHKAHLDTYLAGSTSTKAPVKAPVKVETPKPAPALSFDTSSLVKKYKQLSSLLNDIEGDTIKLVREYDKLRNGQRMNNLETPDLYNLYLAIESLKYTQPMHKEINHMVKSANELPAAAKKYAASRK
ncbi:hypothetical protein fHeYen901_154 [Yersinia phage fHe-Yen9-01]|uniref:Uncharacterized protein n=1 Tax=Yersinia phage fHe-Yen9-01 TaxID=1965363 RepID=A0A1V0DXQ1_9CAUD|nr:hypothetical protein KNT60_gp153 [Yersinia phage fHe-Yen9-01]ARB05927.1 hypothetical protein fHeYen901_154 [Yersinia phage fHe-Yen9-01]